MKRKNLFFFAMVVMFLAAGVLAGQEMPKEIKAVPVVGGLYFVEGLEGGNVAFLATDEGVLVVDSGTTPEEGKLIVAEIARVSGRPIRFLVLTHYHGDHTFGLQAYPPSTVIIAQQNTADNMRSLNEPRLRGMMEKQMPEMIATQKLKVEKLRKKNGKELP
ncbi:MAG TPA: MBL fold metallo-hydrolase, partial [Candidatus Aminicenantes bacterium]|nr:MBL fold metallo-hydrolase [Candidatus Aminicenantes bacterium]